MKFLRDILDKQAPLFEKGGKLEKLYPLWEANDTFLYTPGEVTKRESHVRDALDLKRMMFTVVVAGCSVLAARPSSAARLSPTSHMTGQVCATSAAPLSSRILSSS